MKRTNVMLAIAFATLLPAGVSRAEASCPVTGFESITLPSAIRPAAALPRRVALVCPRLDREPAPRRLLQPERVLVHGPGARVPRRVAPDDHIQIGVDVDWHYKSDNQTEVVSQQSLPTGAAPR